MKINYRQNLPQLESEIFLTDGGLETSLIFDQGFDLPYFAAFDLLKSDKGREVLVEYYRTYAELAAEAGSGLVLESPTWRANTDWGIKMGYDAQRLADVNTRSIDLLSEIRDEFQKAETPIVISGCIGPRGDGYVVSDRMSVEEAKSYHLAQVESFVASQADLVSAFTMTYVDEAIGIVRAAQESNIPVVISFTTETDGRLPAGQTLGDAINEVDAATGNGPVYYMINCAHPDHFSNALQNNEPWLQRIRGIRANASRKSHAELDESEELDSGSPRELGQMYRQLRSEFPQFNILGGCCGTDHRHIGEICRHCVH